MDVLFDRVAGLDVGKASVTVCVRTPGDGGRRRGEVRTFRTMTRSLAVLRGWLLEQGVTVAAMESTGTYWKPVFYALEDHLEVWLLNAGHMKAVPGRKSDVRDAEWISEKTIKNYVSSLLAKLGFERRTQAARVCLEAVPAAQRRTRCRPPRTTGRTIAAACRSEIASPPATTRRTRLPARTS